MRVEIRAAVGQGLLAALRDLEAESLESILSRVPKDVELITQALPISFIPYAPMYRLTEIVLDELGESRSRQVWCQAMVTTAKRPLLQGFVNMAKSVFGLSPRGLFKQSPRVYSHLSHGMGYLQFHDQGDRNCELELCGWPATEWKHEVFSDAFRGTLEGVAAVADRRALVAVLDEKSETGYTRYRISW